MRRKAESGFHKDLTISRHAAHHTKKLCEREGETIRAVRRFQEENAG